MRPTPSSFAPKSSFAPSFLRTSCTGKGGLGIPCSWWTKPGDRQLLEPWEPAQLFHTSASYSLCDNSHLHSIALHGEVSLSPWLPKAPTLGHWNWNKLIFPTLFPKMCINWWWVPEVPSTSGPMQSWTLLLQKFYHKTQCLPKISPYNNFHHNLNFTINFLITDINLS